MIAVPERQEADTITMRLYYLERMIEARFGEVQRLEELRAAEQLRLSDERWRHQETLTRTLQDVSNRTAAAMEIRLDGLNHLQRRIDAQTQTFVNQSEHNLSIQRVMAVIEAEGVRQREAINVLNDKIGALQRFQARLQGQILLIGVFASLLAFAVPFLVKAIGG